ncbi:MBL fold metallo-hydrolase [Salibacterium qingdaonense]|uniref:Glyoxylase, beta-lactamase superfamily II n=1 Tax=Salibacterium qingdaonense TaxID=266892 RepID=A0A1I4KNY9_9BACI|nr:MBL fold metallo-hydrolase [Salibacterium qingdaonense]SFL80266.1 Glyoxylase, beta-lactamase superfamily II [Salibacterium qingdaonense]
MPVQYENQYVTVFQSDLYQTTSTVVVTKDMILIVDPTWLPGEIEAIRQHVAENDGGQHKYLFFTHSDFDHIHGWKAFPEAVTIASRGFVDRTNKKKILQEAQDFDDYYYIERSYPVEYPQIDIIIDHDEQTIKKENTSVSFYLAPGHQADGVFAVIDELGILIAGDYASDVEFPFIHHDSEAYKHTVNKLEKVVDEKNIKLLIPGHGKCTTDRDEMRDRIGDSRWYIETLRDEIRQQKRLDVLEAFVDSFRFSRYLREEHENNKAQIQKEYRG